VIAQSGALREALCTAVVPARSFWEAGLSAAFVSGRWLWPVCTFPLV